MNWATQLLPQAQKSCGSYQIFQSLNLPSVRSDNQKHGLIARPELEFSISDIFPIFYLAEFIV